MLDSPCDPVDPAPSDPPSATEPGSHNLPPTSSAGTAAAIAGAAPKADDASRLLQALWPSQNRVHLAVYRNRAGKFWHVPVASAAKALVTAVAASAQGEDCYFALAEFASGDSRKADNAVSVCAFWLDIDCGADKATKGCGYATQEEGREAIDKFILDADLPGFTHLVNSGSGWHVYWALTEAIDAAAWKVLAQKFKALTQRLGFLSDPSRTADLASVLRMPNTLNHKYTPPKPVTLVEASDVLIEPEAMRLAIEAMHSQVCGAPDPAAFASGPSTQGTVRVSNLPVDIAALRSALAALNPDCEDGEWKLHRLAPLARAAREHPDQANDLKQAAIDFSSGALCGRPSSKWSKPSTARGRSGSEIFEQQWLRFLAAEPTGALTTIATIFKDASAAGWKNTTDAFTEVGETIEVHAPPPFAAPAYAEPGGIVSQSVRLSATHFPDQSRQGDGPPPSTLPNLRYMLQRYGIVVRYDVIKKKIRITIPGHSGSVDNADNVALTKIISLAVLNGLGTGQIPGYVDAIADENLYNPAADWINSRPWDGVDRLPAVYDTLLTREDFPVTLKATLMYRWLLSLVAAALKPRGFKGRGVLTLQGPQGIGKTSWVMSLVDDPALREALVKVDHHLDPSQKDSILGAIAHWIVEIGELDSSFRKDMARLKGVLTSDADKIRRPYARTESEYQRRTVFMATVNEANFLVDHTGNSRWWTLPVVKVNYQHGIDVQQVFAQLAVDFHAGAQWWLTADEDAQLAERNERHRSLSAVEETLMAKLDLDPPEGSEKVKMTALKVLKAAGIEKPSNPQCKDANAFLRRYVGEPKRTKGVNYWSVVLREDDSDSDDDPDPDAPMEPFTGA